MFVCVGAHTQAEGQQIMVMIMVIVADDCMRVSMCQKEKIGNTGMPLGG